MQRDEIIEKLVVESKRENLCPWQDFDGDGWPDLALATANGNLRLFWNRGGGGRAMFEECAHADCNASDNVLRTRIMCICMPNLLYQDVIGHAVADWNNDERLDLFLTGFNGSQLLRGQKDRSFDSFNFLEVNYAVVG